MAWESTKEIVQGQINEFQHYASAAFGTALNALKDIGNSFHSAASAIGVGGSDPVYPDPETGDGYEKPTPPNLPSVTFSAPTAPTPSMGADSLRALLADIAQRFAALEAPTFDVDSPTIQFPSKPSNSLPTAPTDPAPLVAPTYPNAPDLNYPEAPTARDIPLPTLSSPNLAAITALIAALRAAKPTAPTLPDLPDFLGLVATQYTITNQQLTTFIGQCPALANLCPRLAELLAGDSIGIPAAVAQALRDRAFAAEDRQAAQAETEALTDWRARGFTLPGGALEAKLASIRVLNRDKKAQLNRDLWIEEAKLEIENLRFALQQGIAYEGLLRDSWAKLYGIVQAIAQADIDTLVKGLEAALNLYRTQMDGWKTEFETIKDQLQAELAKLEVYKSELDAARLIGQLNQQDVDLYRAQLDALNTVVALYKTQVDAANSLLQAELAKLEDAAKRTQIYTAKIGAYEAAWRAYGIAAGEEKTKAEIYDTQTRAFAARVQAFATENEAVKAMADTEVSALKLLLEEWQVEVEQYKAELQTELGRIEALVKAGGLDLELYKAEVIAEGGYTDWLMKGMDYTLNVSKFNTETSLKNKELAQSKELTLAKIAQDGLDAIARTGSQLAGSAMSAMNVHAQLSSSSSYQEVHQYEETT